jgi:hypothetical protein
MPEVYNHRVLSEQQIVAGETIITTFQDPDDFRWCLLIAQMQSGKTETYLFAACESLRRNIAENVVIFSGNAETDLKTQLINEVTGSRGTKFYNKYKRYLKTHGMSDDGMDDFFDEVKEKISVKWGTDLNKYNGSVTKTLFIWEESHHAQSVHQCPDKFLRNIGISADGDFSILQSKNNFLISISATPFSEISDIYHHSQEKKVVFMKPGTNYNSVEKMLHTGRIKSFLNLEEGLTRALRTEHIEPKYGIIRITKKNEDIVKSICLLLGWTVIVYDSISSKEEQSLGKKTGDNMANRPVKNTAILLRGKCRMGKNLQKEFILFVMETAKNSKTDTVLQGLLGRVCGYSTGSDTIDVYLHQKIVKSEELERYVSAVNSADTDIPTIIPRKANNLATSKISISEPIIPIKITRDRRISNTNNRDAIIQDVVDAFGVDMGRILNKNTPETFHDVKQQIMSAAFGNPLFKRNLKIFYLDEKKKTRGPDKARKIKEAFDTQIATHFGSGCGISADGLEVNIWVPKNIAGFDMNSIYITAHVAKKDNEDNRIPESTGREVFAHRLEDGSEQVGNGGFTILLSSETATSVDAMLSNIKFIIDISLGFADNSRKIASCYDDKDKEFKGIIVSLEVLDSLKEGGRIFETIKQNSGLSLVLQKSRGQIPKCIKEKGFSKLASISW